MKNRPFFFAESNWKCGETPQYLPVIVAVAIVAVD
jgi:hypothetical protein